jgi:solute:Na+ symporter, SSS family
LLGLVYVASLGGVVSVVSDNLNFGSQILLNDVYRRYLVKHATERHYLIAGRLAILVILALSLLVVYRVHFVINVAFFMVGLSAVEMPANWAQWWWWRFNGWGRVAASLGGGLIYIVLALGWPQMPWWDRMFGSIASATALWVVVTLLTQPESSESLARFYERARPLGFWSPIARLVPSAQDTARGLRPILAGLVLAVTGAAAVMAYILGISLFYVAQVAKALLLIAAMCGLGFFFWLWAPRYIDRLLSPAERVAVPESEGNVRFEIFSILTWLSFATCFIAGWQWLFGGRHPAGLVVSIFAGLTGLLLVALHRRALSTRYRANTPLEGE